MFGQSKFPSTPVSQPNQSEAAKSLFGENYAGGDNLFGGNTAEMPTHPTCQKLTLKELGQMLQMIVYEYEELERNFMKMLVEVNACDDVLRDTKQRVFELVENVNSVEKKKDRIRADIEFLETQEKEMDELTAELEKAVGVSEWTDGSQVKLNSSLVPPTKADNQRQHMMQMQVGLDAQIKQASDDLAEILDQIAGLLALTPGSTGEDQEELNSALDQVRNILDYQITALQSINEIEMDVAKKFAVMEERLESERKLH
ncbi:hypothetical protein QR680_016211 [Steinernema hermaphroditum]|uniref:Nucleoporin NSP1-like C-terminal domain-containing protein n=1 Tax=Steinernema hermaphroditum TaxID=289476 RepID=A0AA39HCY9_9BILA|nr:hypothetical protein QR680_016211 [Steinernema hermaphroditum]